MSKSREDEARRKVEELLLRANTLSKSGQAGKGKKNTVKKKPSLIESAQEKAEQAINSVSLFPKLILDCREVFLGIYERILAPLWIIFGPPIRWIWSRYQHVWEKYAYYIDAENGERKISRSRSTALCLLFIASLSIFTPTILGNMVRFITIEPIIDTASMLISLSTEEYFLTHSEEIDSDNNIHAVRGCRFRNECTEKDSVYFRVKPRLSHDAWKLIQYGDPFFIPDHVVAPIAPGVNKCQVTYYGYRMTSSWISRIMRSLQLYPVMLEANCVFVGAVNQ